MVVHEGALTKALLWVGASTVIMAFDSQFLKYNWKVDWKKGIQESGYVICVHYPGSSKLRTNVYIYRYHISCLNNAGLQTCLRYQPAKVTGLNRRHLKETRVKFKHS